MISITLLRAQAPVRFKLLLFSQQYASELSRIGNQAFRKVSLSVCVFLCAGLQRSLQPCVCYAWRKTSCCKRPLWRHTALGGQHSLLGVCFVPSLFSWWENSRLAGKLLARHTTEPEGLPMASTGQSGKLKFQLHNMLLETCSALLVWFHFFREGKHSKLCLTDACQVLKVYQGPQRIIFL